jgi:hypothetical protein
LQNALARPVLRYGYRPAVAFALLTGASAMVYVPLALAFNPLHWTTIGPFAFQTSRLLHYGVYFTAGIAVGASGVASGVFSPAGRLARRWPFWSLAAVLCFGLAMSAAVIAATQPGSPLVWGSVAGVTFAISCAASSFALMSVFVRWFHTGVRLFDNARSNAYTRVMMYVSHRVIPISCSRLSRNWESARRLARRPNRRILLTSSCWRFRSRRSQASRAILRLR